MSHPFPAHDCSPATWNETAGEIGGICFSWWGPRTLSPAWPGAPKKFSRHKTGHCKRTTGLHHSRNLQKPKLPLRFPDVILYHRSYLRHLTPPLLSSSSSSGSLVRTHIPPEFSKLPSHTSRLMGSSEESKPSIVYDSSSSTQPLLSAADPAVSPQDADDDQYPPISYQHGPRPLRDLPALLLFLLLSLSTIAFGLVAVARRNPAASRASSFVFDPASSSCVPPPSNTLSLSLSLSLSSSSPFLKDLIWTLVVTLLLSGPIALAILWLLRHYAKQVVYTALPFFVLIPAFINVYWFAACTLNHGCRHSFPLAYRILALIFIFLLIAIILWIIVANWRRVELTVRIVQIAAAALTGNISLVAVPPALGLGLLVYFAPLVVFLVYSTWNGNVVPKEKEGPGGDYYWCVWRQDGWVPAYFALAIITMIWSVATMVEAQVYVISGTIAQWYFSKEGSKPSRSIRSSLRYG